MNNSTNNYLKYNQIMLTKKRNYNKRCFFSILQNIEIYGALRIDRVRLFHTEAAEILKDLLVICNQHRAYSSCMG